MRDVSLLDRENFGTFRLLEVSPTIVSVCVIVITYIVSPASWFAERGNSGNPQTVQSRIYDAQSELVSSRKAIFVFPLVAADDPQRSFEQHNRLF